MLISFDHIILPACTPTKIGLYEILLGRFASSASLPRIPGCFAPSGFMLRTHIFCCFAPSGFALPLHAYRASRSRKFSKNISVSQSTRNALKRIEMQKKKKKKKKIISPSTRNALCGEAQPYLPHVNPRVPNSVPCQVSCRLVQNCGC